MGTNGFVRAASTKDVKEGRPLCASVGGAKIALFAKDGKYFAIDNLCTHAGGPLCEGSAKDGVVTCPWHGSQFNVETGEVMHGPAKDKIKTYAVEVRGDDIYVSLS